MPGSLDGLRALHATGLRLAIVSNSDGTLEERLAREGICQAGPGAGVPMSIVIDSAAVGVAKPDPAIFTIALDACGVAPERVVHVGDAVGADVAGAGALGNSARVDHRRDHKHDDERQNPQDAPRAADI